MVVKMHIASVKKAFLFIAAAPDGRERRHILEKIQPNPIFLPVSFVSPGFGFKVRCYNIQLSFLGFKLNVKSALSGENVFAKRLPENPFFRGNDARKFRFRPQSKSLASIRRYRRIGVSHSASCVRPSALLRR
jgi:hypothetical protein